MRLLAAAAETPPVGHSPGMCLTFEASDGSIAVLLHCASANQFPSKEVEFTTMKTHRILMGLGLIVALTAANASAGEVTVKGVHLCCGQCVKLVAKALGSVDGVSSAACDRKAKTVKFTASDDKAAGAAIKALAKSGFHGTAAHGDKKLAFPPSGVKKGDKADTVTFTGVHLCCGACVKGVAAALKDIDAKPACDTKAKTVTLTGSGIDVSKAVAALNKAGFNATVKSKK